MLHRLVDLLCQQQRYDEADQEIRKLQKQGPLDGDLQRLAVAISLQSQDSVRAVNIALQTVRDNSMDYRDYLWLGQVLAAAGQTRVSGPSVPAADEAEKQFRRAVELAPQVPDTWLALVRYLANTQKGSEADQVIDQARAQLPKESRTLTLAACFEAVGQLDRAADEYRRALNAQPRDPAVLRNVVSFYLRSGKLEEAEPILKRLMGEPQPSANGGEANWARRQLAFILMNRGEYREALAMVGLGFDPTGNIVEKSPLSHNSAVDSSGKAGDEAVEEMRARARALAAFGSHSARDRAIV